MDIEKLSNDDLEKYIESKLAAFSIVKEKMQVGIDYYNYKQAIDEKRRVVLGRDGKLVTIRHLPNTKIKDNQYARMLDQKRAYVLSQRPNVNVRGENSQGGEFADEFIDKRFLRTLNKIATDSYNCGIAWMYLYTDGNEIKYTRVDPRTIIPLWSDDNHEGLDGVIRFISKSEFENGNIKVKHYLYLYTRDKIKIFDYTNGNLKFIKDDQYLRKGETAYSYKQLPFVYFKHPNELPLIDKIRCLQDALNLLLSNYADNMFENPMNSILVLKNYEGEDLGEFREKLAQYAAVKIRTADGSSGGVDTLEIDVNSENYKVIIEMIKKAIAQNARGLYLENDRTNNAPNSLNIKAMYSDMELDANDLELEFSASFEYLFDFISDIVEIDFSGLEIQFKRSIMVNDESTVDIIKNSVGILSDETLIQNHPFVTDVKKEIELKEKEDKEKYLMMDDYLNLGGDFRDDLLGKAGTEIKQSGV